MKQVEDTKTIDMLGLPKRRGRPPSGNAKTGAQRVAELRARRLQEGRADVTVCLPLDVIEALNSFIKFKDTNKDAVVEKLIRSQIMRKR